MKLENLLIEEEEMAKKIEEKYSRLRTRLSETIALKNVC